MTLSRAHFYTSATAADVAKLSVCYTITQTSGNASSHAEYYDRAEPKPTPQRNAVNVIRITSKN